MARLAKLVAALSIGLGSFAAHAGYAQLAPPERFSGAYPEFKFAPSANDARYGKIAWQKEGLRLPIPGKNVTMPAAYRFAANAPRFAAAAVFLSPHLRLAIGIASWLGVAGLVWDDVYKVWKSTDISEEDEPSTGFEYRMVKDGFDTGWMKSNIRVCSAAAAGATSLNSSAGYSYNNPRVIDGYCYIDMTQHGRPYANTKDEFLRRGSSCPIGWYVTPAGCVQTPQPKVLTEPEFIEKLAPKPMPDTVPWELPYPTPLPVDDPFINPDPVTNPQHKPKFIPTGDPVPNPNYDPKLAPGPDNQPWVQPGVRVTPRPVPGSPWQVDITPVNRPQSSPEPLPDVPDQPQPEDKPKPEEQQSLCEKHPDIVACAKMDDVNSDTVKNESKTISITPKTGWGSENASCPAPKVIAVANINAEFSYQPICDLASGLRPIVIALAWLSAATMVITAARRSS